MKRTVLHVDADSFFASVECARNPSLKNKPMAVAAGWNAGRGIILSANYIAKKQYGVKAADVVWEAKRKCPDIELVYGDMRVYREYSEKLFAILSSYSDFVEPFGCDEAWVELKGILQGKGRETADRIRERVKKELGITVSVGISFNKVFAKLGSDLNKPDGVAEITRDNYQTVAWDLPVEKLLFVGEKTRKILNMRAVYTIGDLAKTEDSHIKAWLGKSGITIRDYARGTDNAEVMAQWDREEEKTMSATVTCPHNLTTTHEVKGVLMALSGDLGERLRQKSRTCASVTVKIRNTDLEWISKGGKIELPTNATREIFEYAMYLFEKSGMAGKTIRSIGINVGDLGKMSEWIQLDFIGESDRHLRLMRLDRTLDRLKLNFGKGFIKRGITLLDDYPLP